MNAVERIKEIFSQALEKKPGPERDDFLAEVCRGDSELRQQMESQLLAYERAGEFLGKTMHAGQDEQRVKGLHALSPYHSVAMFKKENNSL